MIFNDSGDVKSVEIGIFMTLLVPFAGNADYKIWT